MLEGGGIECRIREDFCPNFLDLRPAKARGELLRSNSLSKEPHLGDLLRREVNDMDSYRILIGFSMIFNRKLMVFIGF